MTALTDAQASILVFTVADATIGRVPDGYGHAPVRLLVSDGTATLSVRNHRGAQARKIGERIDLTSGMTLIEALTAIGGDQSALEVTTSGAPAQYAAPAKKAAVKKRAAHKPAAKKAVWGDTPAARREMAAARRDVAAGGDYYTSGLYDLES